MELTSYTDGSKVSTKYQKVAMDLSAKHFPFASKKKKHPYLPWVLLILEHQTFGNKDTKEWPIKTDTVCFATYKWRASVCLT